jgi:hypothetical protein
MKSRISILKEDQIWELRCQGYRYELIAEVVNCSPVSMTKVLRRVRQRPPIQQDPIKRGRSRGFLSDAQVQNIRERAKYKEPLGFIARSYDMTPEAITAIINYKTYKEPCMDDAFIPNFTNRLTR